MGIYLGVNAVIKKGKPSTSKTYQPQPGHRTIAILDNGLYRIAWDVTQKSAYDAMYDAYGRGAYTHFSLYLLPENEVENCPDEGRVYI